MTQLLGSPIPVSDGVRREQAVDVDHLVKRFGELELRRLLVGQAILSSNHIEAHLSNPGVLRAVAGSGLYLAVLGLLALGIGTLIRHTAGAIASLFGLIFVLPGLVLALPTSWSNAISKYLPSSAGQAIFRTVRDRSTLSPWAGFALFCAYAAGVLIVAGITLRHRDA